METVLAGLVHHRRSTPLDDRTSAVGCTDRRLVVLVPDQRPTEYLAPELADLACAVGIDRPETRAAGKEVAVRRNDAELVSLGIGEHDMTFFLPLADVHAARASFDQSVDCVLLILD